jgi:hypothetical protein
MSYPHQSGRSRVAGIAGGLRAEKKTGQKPCNIANAEVAGGWHVSESDQVRNQQEY